MGKKFVQVQTREAQLMCKWQKDGETVARIMALTGRCKETVLKHTSPKKKPMLGSGRRKIITPRVFLKLEKAMRDLQKRANGYKEISADNIKAKANVQVSNRVLLDAFHDHDIWFRPLRQKPILTDDDIEKRKVFADAYRSRSKGGWVEMPHAIIDNKNFPIYKNGKDRHEAARRQVRGGFRRRGDQPKPYLVKRKPECKYSAPSVQVTAAIIKGKIRVFNFVDGKWNGEKAANMYKGPLLTALRKAFPEKGWREKL